jgi:hypothetical protein
MKQTAVEWLFEQTIQLNSDMKYSVINWETYLSKRAELLEQAKEMEKKQITETFVKVSRAHQEALGNKLSLQDIIDYKKIAEVYYNEEYETKKD